MRIAFDFDGTCLHGDDWNEHTFRLLMRSIVAGHDVCIVTTRNPAHEDEGWYKIHEPERITVRQLLEVESIDIPVYYTNHAPKLGMLRELGVYRLFDDDCLEIDRVRSSGLQGIAMAIADAPLRSLETNDLPPCDCCEADPWLVGYYEIESGRICPACLSDWVGG